jgi:hypothetical protein
MCVKSGENCAVNYRELGRHRTTQQLQAKGCTSRNESMPHPQAVDTTKTIPGEEEQGARAAEQIGPQAFTHTRAEKEERRRDGRASFFTLIRNSFRATRCRAHTHVSRRVCVNHERAVRAIKVVFRIVYYSDQQLFICTRSVQRYARQRFLFVFALCAQISAAAPKFNSLSQSRK